MENLASIYEIMGRNKTLKRKTRDRLNIVGITSFYLMPVAVMFSVEAFYVVAMVMGLCYWIIAYIDLFKEPYKKGRLSPYRNEDGTLRDKL